jgi:hypothetical protein
VAHHVEEAVERVLTSQIEAFWQVPARGELVERVLVPRMTATRSAPHRRTARSTCAASPWKTSVAIRPTRLSQPARVAGSLGRVSGMAPVAVSKGTSRRHEARPVRPASSAPATSPLVTPSALPTE